MPVVKTETIHIDGKEFKLQVRVNADGKFRIKVPGMFQEKIGCSKEVVEPTMDKAWKAFNKLWKQYRAAQTTTRKVILYQCGMQARIIGADGECKLDVDDSDCHFTPGIVLAVAAVVAEESTTYRGEGQRSYKNYKGLDSSIPESLSRKLRRVGCKDDSEVLEWTPEREEFFRQIGLAMEDLILRLNSVFGDTKKLLKFIDDGALTDKVAGGLPLPGKE